MPTRDQLITALRQADQAGDTAAAQRFAQMIKAMPVAAPAATSAPAAQPGSFWGRLFDPKTIEQAAGVVSNSMMPQSALSGAALPTAGLLGLASGKGAQGGGDVVSAVNRGGGGAGNMLPDMAKQALSIPSTALDRLGTGAANLVGPEQHPLGAALAKATVEGPVQALGLEIPEGSAARMLPKSLRDLYQSKKVKDIPAEARTVHEAGLPLTVGQVWKNAEGGVKRWIADKQNMSKRDSWFGEPVARAEARLPTAYVPHVINKALKQIGAEPLPKGMTGQTAIDYLHNKYVEKYQGMLSRMKGNFDLPSPKLLNHARDELGMTIPSDISTAGMTFRQALENFKVGTNRYLGDHAKLVNSFIDREFLKRADLPPFEKGVVSGERLQNMDEALRNFEDQLRKDKNSYAQEAYTVVSKGLRPMFDEMVQRSNPQLAAEYDRLKTGYYDYKRIEDAAAGPAAAIDRKGMFTPREHAAAIANYGRKKGRQSQVAAGKMRGQKFATDVANVSRDAMPNSGTGQTNSFNYGVHHPKAALTQSAIAIPASLFYSEPIQRLLVNRTMSGKPLLPELARPFAQGVGREQGQQELEARRQLLQQLGIAQ